MDISTSIYDTPIDIKSNIYTSLENDFMRLREYLNSDEEYYFPVHPSLFTVNNLNEILEKNNGYLPEDIQDRIKLFLSEVLQISPDDINNIDQERFKMDHDKIKSIINLTNLYFEQLAYMHGGQETSKSDLYYVIDDMDKERNKDLQYFKGCKWWYIEGNIDNNIYGGIFAFWNGSIPNNILIQGIAKRLIPALVSLLLPEYNKFIPKLNTVLESGIESLARRIGSTTIYVIPIGKQGKILENHYGYKKIKKEKIDWTKFDFRYPCVEILDYKSNIKQVFRMNKKVYYKKIE